MELQVVFAEADQGLNDGNGAGDACDKEHGKPEGLEKSAKGKLPEHEGHGLESETEGAQLGAFLDVVAGDEHRHGNHDGAAQDNFGKSVGSACSQGRKHQVFLGFQVTGVAEHDTHAKAHGEEHLARRRKPHGGVEHFREVRVPHEGKALADVGNGKHAYHQDNAHDEEDGHGHLVYPLDTFAYAEGQKPHVAGEGNQEEQDGGGNGANLGVQHDVVAEEFLHGFVAASHNFHELSGGGIVGKCQNPGLDKDIVEADEQRG